MVYGVLGKHFPISWNDLRVNMVHILVPIDSLDVVAFLWDVKFIMSMSMVRWYLFISGPENRLALFSQRLTLSSHWDFHLEWIWSVWNYFPNAMNSWQAILSQSSWQVYNWNSLSRCCIKGRRKSYWTIFPMAKFRQEEVEEVDQSILLRQRTVSTDCIQRNIWF